jgi:hypothetical protein
MKIGQLHTPISRFDPLSADTLAELHDDEQRLVALWRKARAYRRQADDYARHQNEADRLCSLALTDIEMMLREIEQ